MFFFFLRNPVFLKHLTIQKNKPKHIWSFFHGEHFSGNYNTIILINIKQNWSQETKSRSIQHSPKAGVFISKVEASFINRFQVYQKERPAGVAAKPNALF